MGNRMPTLTETYYVQKTLDEIEESRSPGNYIFGVKTAKGRYGVKMVSSDFVASAMAGRPKEAIKAAIETREDALSSVTLEAMIINVETQYVARRQGEADAQSEAEE